MSKKPKNEFLEVLEKNVDNKLPSEQVLRDFCSGIEKFLEKQAECSAHPAGRSELGQEYKVCIRCGGYSALLLKAHLNENGRATLDFLDRKVVTTSCDVPEFKQKLRNFLSAPGVADMLKGMVR